MLKRRRAVNGSLNYPQCRGTPGRSLFVCFRFFCFSYLAAVASSLDVSGAHLVISDSAVQVGRPVADLVLDDGEAHLLQEAVAARTCGRQPHPGHATRLPHCEEKSMLTGGD